MITRYQHCLHNARASQKRKENMRIYKLYAALSNAAALCSINIARNGKIQGLKWQLNGVCKTDAAQALVECSFQAASFINVNDTAGPIDQVGLSGNFVTSGMDSKQVNQYTPMNLPVQLGEKLYLNCVIAGTISGTVTCFIYVEE